MSYNPPKEVQQIKTEVARFSAQDQNDLMIELLHAHKNLTLCLCHTGLNPPDIQCRNLTEPCICYWARRPCTVDCGCKGNCTRPPKPGDDY